MKRASLLTLTLIGAFSAINFWAVDYPLPPNGSRLVGQNQTYTVQEGIKPQAIARRFDTAAMLILQANNYRPGAKTRY